MSNRKGHRAWGSIKRQRTKQPSYQASFLGPDKRRYYAPHIFGSKGEAERWLSKERDVLDKCTATDERWKPPAERATEKKAEVLTFGVYGKRVIDERTLSPRTRIEYNAKWSQLIEPTFGKTALRSITPADVRAWFSGLDASKETRNRHAYAIVSMICNTAVHDGLIERNPCMIKGATKTKGKKNTKLPSIGELHAIADTLGTDERYERFRALVLITAWCGLRFGDVSELRRRDFDRDCTTVAISRSVTHRIDPANPDADRCRIKDGTKNGEQRTVVIPPHIRDDVKSHLNRHVSLGPDALLFAPARGGCHMDDRVFNKDVLQRAAKAIGLEDISVHDLRHFAGTQNARVSPVAENMARLGHKTVSAAMRYQHAQDGADAKLAAALSVNALAELAATTDADGLADEAVSATA
jgi:integrase